MAFPRKRSEKYGIEILDPPIIKSPISSVMSHWQNNQRGPCADYELDWARCASRVGYHGAHTQCKEFLDDFLECAWRPKATKRYELMQHERKKQGKPFLEKPPPDSTRSHMNLDYGMDV